MFEVGQRVRARDALWQVLDARQFDGYTSVALRSLGRPVVERTLIHPIDRLEPLQPPDWTFDVALPKRWSLLLDAQRLSIAHRRRDLLSLGRTKLVIEPYQLLPVMQVMSAPRQRNLLADDVGLGKTVQAGLVMAELIARGRGDRVLIVTPAALVGQWQEEMRDKFDLAFDIFDADTIDTLVRQLPAGANPWHYRNRVLTSIDYAKQDRVWRVLKAVKWDLVIFDEAHYLAESGTAANPVRTDRSRFAAGLSELTDSLLLLTATPHNGYDHSFWSLLSLIDPLRFPTPESMTREGVQEMMVRRTKRGIRNQDGSPRFKDRQVLEVMMNLEAPEFAEEKRLYDAVTRYAGQHWRRAKRSGTAEKLAVGFAMTVLKKRAASSIGALRESLRHRLEDMSPDVMVPNVRRGLFASYRAGVPLNESQSERVEQQALAIPVETDAGALERERQTLERLLRQTERIAGPGDHKAATLRAKLEELSSAEPDRKIIIFTEYRDTQDYLAENLRDHDLGEHLITMHGGMDRAERERAIASFNGPGPAILLATDAASEGLNLQFRCHTVIHYELPWNPNRLEQRNGRVDRWGQERDVEVYNLVVAGTVEDDILSRLVKKIERIRRAVGTASDVLGVISGLDVEGAIMEAEDGRTEQVALRLEGYIDEHMRQIANPDTTASLLSLGASFGEYEWEAVEREIGRTREEVPGEEQIERFVRGALEEFGGQIQQREPGVYAVEVPVALQDRGVEPVYEHATFRRDLALADRDNQLQFITTGHPLLGTLVGRVKLAVEEDPARWRMTVLVLPEERAGFLALYLTRFADGAGSTVQEILTPVFVGLDGTVVTGEEAQQLLHIPSLRRNPPTDLRERYEPSFAAAMARANEAAAGVVDHERTSLAVEQETLVEKLRADLQRWATGRRDWIERRGMSGQLPMFGGSTSYRDRQLALVDIKARQREAELERMRAVSAGTPELVAMAAIVPGGER